MATSTTTYAFLKPAVGGDTNLWGGYLNDNLDDLDDLLDGTAPVSGIDINGGSIDGTPIGAAAASTGAFTTLSTTGNASLAGGSLFVDAATFRVGIGTATPDVLLHMEVNFTPTARWENTSISGYSQIQGNGSNMSIQVDPSNATANSVLDFDIDGAQVASMGPTGLRIGTSGGNPTYQLQLDGTGAIKLPVGTTAQRPATTPGLLRYNSDTGSVEVYNAGSWKKIDAGLALLGLAAGDLVYASGADALARLAAGTDGQILGLSGGLPAWQPNSGRVLLEDQTLGAPAATIDFTAFDNSIYNFYEFELVNVSPVTDNLDLFVRFSNTGGASYLATSSYDYYLRSVAIGGTGITSNTSATTAIKIADGIGSAAGELGVCGTVKLYPGTLATSKPYLTIERLINDTTAGVHYQHEGAGRYDATTVVDALRFQPTSGNLDTGSRIRMYGLV
jgi:hypothetical protein